MITSTTTRETYSGDGVTTTFAVPFKFLASGDLVVVKRTSLTYESAPDWAPLTAYVADNIVHGVHLLYTDHIYKCTVAGTSSASSGPEWSGSPTGTGAAISDGVSLLWAFVTRDGLSSDQALSTHYTVLGAGDASGGSVTFLPDYIPAVGEEVIIYNDPALTQEVDYVSGDSFPAETHETALDRVTLQQKRTREIAERALGLPDRDIDGAGAYDAHLNRIKNLSAPTLAADAATKTYVDVAVTNAAFSEPTGIVATGSSEPRDLADRWAQQFNVKDYGADDTGLVNTTAYIQAALDACNTAGGGTVYFPKGDYLVIDAGDDTALLVYDNTRIVCDHDAWIKTATADISIFRNASFGSFAEPGGWTGGNSNIEMDHVNVDSSAVVSGWVGASAPAHGVFHFENVSGLSIHHCTILNASKTAIRMRHNDNFDISHNEIDGSGIAQKSTNLGSHSSTPAGHDVQYGHAINGGGDHQGIITSNRLLRTWGAVIVMFSNYGEAGPESYDIIISDNYIEGGEDNGIRLQPAGENDDADDWYEGPYNPETLYNIHIVNNTIKDCIGHFIRAQGNQLVISGNILVKDVMWNRGADPHTAILTGSTWPYLQKLDNGDAGVGIAIATGGDDVICTGNIIRTNTSIENGKIQGPAFDSGITVRVDYANYFGAKRSKIVISNNVIDGCRAGVDIYGGTNDLELIEDVIISDNVIALDQNDVDSTADWTTATGYAVGQVVKRATPGTGQLNRYVCTDAITASDTEPDGTYPGQVALPLPDPPTGWSNGPIADDDGFWELLSTTEVAGCIRVNAMPNRITISGNNCSYGKHGISIAGGTFPSELLSATTVDGGTTVTLTGGTTTEIVRPGMVLAQYDAARGTIRRYTRVVMTDCEMTASSAVITMSDTGAGLSELQKGMNAYGPGIPAGAKILSVIVDTSVTLDAVVTITHDPSVGAPLTGATIVFEDPHTRVVAITNTTQFTVDHAPTFTGAVSFSFYARSQNVTVTDNICWNNDAEADGGYGIYLVDTEGFVISGNRCFDDRSTARQNGIRIQDVDSGVVMGNVLTKTADAVDGIGGNAESVTNTQVFGNVPASHSVFNKFHLGQVAGEDESLHRWRVATEYIAVPAVTHIPDSAAPSNSQSVTFSAFSGLTRPNSAVVVGACMGDDTAAPAELIFSGVVTSSTAVRIKVVNVGNTDFAGGVMKFTVHVLQTTGAPSAASGLLI